MERVSSGRPARGSVPQFAQFAKGDALRLKVVGRLRNRHQAPQLQAGQGGDGTAQGERLIRAQPLLLASPETLTWTQTCSGGRWPGAGRQALGDLQAVDGMHPVKVLGHRRGLVALQRADEMPFEVAPATAAILSMPSCT
jgi:hypothetical protein